MKLKILKSGILPSEYRFGINGFASNRRHLRPGNDDISITSNSTPSTGSRTAARSDASEMQCNVGYQNHSADLQRHCIRCCVSHALRILQQGRFIQMFLNVYFAGNILLTTL